MTMTTQMPEALEDEAAEVDSLFDGDNETEGDTDLEASAEVESADDDNARHPDDPRCNEHGVFNQDVEAVEVPMRKKSNVKATISIAQGSNGRWWASYHYQAIKDKGGSASMGGGHAPALKYPSFDTRTLAAVNALIELETVAIGNGNKSMAEDAAKFKAIVEAWPDSQPTDVTAGSEDNPMDDIPPEPEDFPSEQQPDAIADYEQRLDDATKRVARTALYQAKCEAESKHAKAEAKSALEELQKIVNRGPEQYPLFDGQPAKAATDETGGETAGELTSEDAEAAEDVVIHDDDESWKEVSIATLGLPAGVVKSLNEADNHIFTIGDLATWTAKYALTDIEGIGQAKADKIDDALAKFWADRKAGAA